MKRVSSVFGALLLLAGAVSLMGVDCGGAADCSYAGKSFQSGASFASDDGCNSCSCSNGQILCTERACAPQWFRTCGDPVCSTHKADPSIAACTTQKVGDACTNVGTVCDPIDACNVHLICAVSDPTKQVGGCPISRAAYKRDIHYLDGAERSDVKKTLLGTRLATWRYKAGSADAPLQLGFIIDDVGRSPSVNADGESVNLYGYTSMAVAALQAQSEEIDALRSEVRELKALVAGGLGKPGKPGKKPIRRAE